MTTKRAPRTAWKPGESGNPAGRPKGSRNRVTRMVAELLEGEAEAITRRCIESAMAGDMTAVRLVLERLLPPAKERPVSLELPEDVTTAGGVAQAQAAILEAVACGELLPSEASTVAGILEQRRRAIETAELEARLSALEGKAP